MRLIIEAGHDPKFPGASHTDRDEVHFTRIIKFQVIALFEGLSKFVDIVNVPDLGGNSASDNLKRKIEWINKHGGKNDLLLSIHANAGRGTGIEVLYAKGNKKTEAYAKELSRSVSETTGLRDRGAKDDTQSQHKRLAILRDTKPSALLIEAGFVDNPIDVAVPAAKFSYGIWLWLWSLVQK